MHVTNIKKSVTGCLFTITSFLLLTVPVLGTEQEIRKLELVRTYHSEAEIQAAYPEIFPQQAIQDKGEYIIFSDPQTRQSVKQIKKTSPQVLREEKTKNDTIIWEKRYQYTVLEDKPFLLVTEWEGGRLKSEIASPQELQGKPQKRTLYNSKGEEIAQLPPELNLVKLSPDKQHFLATGYYEEPSPFVYLYSINGELLKTLEFTTGATANFSQSGESFKVIADGKLLIFSKTGELIYENAYKSLQGFMNGYTTFFVLDAGQFFLMDTSGDLSLFSIDNERLWEVPSPPVLDYSMDKEKDILQLRTLSEDHNPDKQDFYRLDIRTLSTGKLLERIEGISSQTRLINDIALIHKGGKFYEYRLQK